LNARVDKRIEEVKQEIDRITERKAEAEKKISQIGNIETQVESEIEAHHKNKIKSFLL
jgi:predicted  nucleic acid-binding Zn-ribbon protein